MGCYKPDSSCRSLAHHHGGCAGWNGRAASTWRAATLRSQWQPLHSHYTGGCRAMLLQRESALQHWASALELHAGQQAVAAKAVTAKRAEAARTAALVR